MDMVDLNNFCNCFLSTTFLNIQRQPGLYRRLPTGDNFEKTRESSDDLNDKRRLKFGRDENHRKTNYGLWKLEDIKR